VKNDWTSFRTKVHGIPSCCNVADLTRRLGVKKPVSFKIGPSIDVEVRPERTVIHTNLEARRKIMPLLLAQARLGETDPLLSTFFFRQEQMTPREHALAMEFRGLCFPLQEAWGYGVLRRTVPIIYNLLIDDLFGNIDRIAHRYRNRSEGKRAIENHEDICAICTSIAVSSENPDLRKFRENKYRLNMVTGNSPLRRHLSQYLETITTFAQMEPSVEHYLKIPEAIEAPYRISVDSESGKRHFSIDIKTESNTDESVAAGE